MSTQPKFTPGPWFIRRASPNNAHLTVFVSSYDILTLGCNGFPYVGPPESSGYLEAVAEVKANANLIAAAPEMYECLESLIGKTNNPLIDQHIKEVLAEARGES